jgi:quercetin dioxygenase-like cupin family protein
MVAVRISQHMSDYVRNIDLGQTMVKAGDVLDLGPIGATFHVRRTSADTDGRLLAMEWVLLPRSSGTPIHVHPSAVESYEVLEGELDLYVNGGWTKLAVGEEASVNPGVPHTFRNSSDSQTRVYNVHAPAMRFGEYFGGIDRVVRSGKVPHNRMSLKTVLYLSLLMTSFADEIASVRPPQSLMKGLATLARLLGYRLPASRDPSAAPDNTR